MLILQSLPVTPIHQLFFAGHCLLRRGPSNGSPARNPSCRASNSRLQVVFVSTEVAPWSKTGGLGDIAAALPVALAARGHQVMTVAPRYADYPGVFDTGLVAPVEVSAGLLPPPDAQAPPQHSATTSVAAVTGAGIQPPAAATTTIATAAAGALQEARGCLVAGGGAVGRRRPCQGRGAGVKPFRVAVRTTRPRPRPRLSSSRPGACGRVGGAPLCAVGGGIGGRRRQWRSPEEGQQLASGLDVGATAVAVAAGPASRAATESGKSCCASSSTTTTSRTCCACGSAISSGCCCPSHQGGDRGGRSENCDLTQRPAEGRGPPPGPGPSRQWRRQPQPPPPPQQRKQRQCRQVHGAAPSPSPSPPVSEANTVVTYARFYACQDRGVLRVFVDHPVFRAEAEAQAEGGQEGGHIPRSHSRAGCDGIPATTVGVGGGSSGTAIGAGASSSNCTRGCGGGHGTNAGGGGRDSSLAGPCSSNLRRKAEPDVVGLPGGPQRADPSLGVYTYSEGLSHTDLQARNSVLCQAALAAPVLLWLNVSGIPQELQNDLADVAADPAELPPQALPYILRNGRAEPAITLQPGGAEQLQEALRLRLRARAVSGSVPHSTFQGASRSSGPESLRRTGPADSRPRCTDAGPGAEAGAEFWPPLQQQRQRQQQQGELLFVGNDWPSALLPLWLQTYREVLVSAASWRVLLEARLRQLRHPLGGGGGGAGEPDQATVDPFKRDGQEAVRWGPNGVVPSSPEANGVVGSTRIRALAPSSAAAAVPALEAAPAPGAAAPGAAATSGPSAGPGPGEGKEPDAASGPTCPQAERGHSEARLAAMSSQSTGSPPLPPPSPSPHGPLQDTAQGWGAHNAAADGAPTEGVGQHAPADAQHVANYNRGEGDGRKDGHEISAQCHRREGSDAPGAAGCSSNTSSNCGGSGGRGGSGNSSSVELRVELSAAQLRAEQAHQEALLLQLMYDMHGITSAVGAAALTAGTPGGAGVAAEGTVQGPVAVGRIPQQQEADDCALREETVTADIIRGRNGAGDGRDSVGEDCGAVGLEGGQGTPGRAADQRRMRSTLRSFQHFLASRLHGAKVVLAVHNLAYQGLFPEDTFGRLGLSLSAMNQMLLGGGGGIGAGDAISGRGSSGSDGTEASSGLSANAGTSSTAGAPESPVSAAGGSLGGRLLSWLKAALLSSDVLVTVSSGYARELVGGTPPQVALPQQADTGPALPSAPAPAPQPTPTSAGEGSNPRAVAGRCRSFAVSGDGAGLPTGARELCDIIAERGMYGIMNGLDEAVWDPATDVLLSPDVRYGREGVREGKARAKAQLQAHLGLEVNPDVPLFGFVGRLEQQKGVDVILAALPQLLGPPATAAEGKLSNRLLGHDREAALRAVQQVAQERDAGAQKRLPRLLQLLLGGLYRAASGLQQRRVASSAATSPAGPADSTNRVPGASSEAASDAGASSDGGGGGGSPGSGAGSVPSGPRRPRLQVAMLGAGEQWLQDSLASLPRVYPGAASGVVGFDEPLSRLMMAGCDFLLVPSRWEPCGLVALAALRYGAVPVVAPTGGLVDAIMPTPLLLTRSPPASSCGRDSAVAHVAAAAGADESPPVATDVLGIVMDRPVGRHDDSLAKREAVSALVRAVRQACGMYGTAAFDALRDKCMAQDVSWGQPAQRWEQLLQRVASGEEPGAPDRVAGR